MLIPTLFDELQARDLKLQCGSYYDTKHPNRDITLYQIAQHFQTQITFWFWNIFKPMNYK